jgi:hypothetical protein
MVEFWRTCYQVSLRRASQTFPCPRSTLYYRSRKIEQAPLSHRIKEIAAIRVRYGFGGYTRSLIGKAGKSTTSGSTGSIASKVCRCATSLPGAG